MRPATRAGRLTAYTDDAAQYDERTATFCTWRELAVDVLPLSRGDRVIDVGCGTGLCFARIESAVGSSGQIIGIDESTPMLDLARQRVSRNGWSNVELIAGPAHLAKLRVSADAAIFCAVHDVLQDSSALEAVLGQLRPGSWVSAVGGRWAPAYLVALNLVIRALHAPYIRDFRGFDHPWALLERGLEDVSVDAVAAGSGFCMIGHTPRA